MTKRDERAQEAEPAVKSEAQARVPRRPRTRVISEAVVAVIPEAPRRETRVVSEAVVAAIPAKGRADDDGARA